MAATPLMLVCPYCNAQMPRPEGQNQLICPRCNEQIPWRGIDGEEPSGGNQADEATRETSSRNNVAATPTRPWDRQLALFSGLALLTSFVVKMAWPSSNWAQRGFPFMILMAAVGLVTSLWLWFFRTRRTNAVTAVFIMANMACAALVALAFALSTVTDRRGNDPRPLPAEPKSVQQPQRPVPPALLAGLGYLPEDCNLVVGMHVAELEAQPGGAKLIHRTPGAEEDPPPWLIDIGVKYVEKLTGQKTHNVDHLLLAMRSTSGLPQLIIVVRTRQAFDEVALTKAQGPVVPVKHHGRHLYQFQTPPIGEGLLYCADPQTLVLLLGLLVDGDKELLSPVPRASAVSESQPLRELLQKRLQVGTQIWWAATGTEQAGNGAMLLPLGQKDPALAKTLRDVKSVVVGLRLDSDAVLTGSLECFDAEKARTAATLLENQHLPGFGSPQVVGPPPESTDAWVSFQLRGSPDAVLGLLRSVRLGKL